MGNGAIFEGTKGILLADFTGRVVIPNNDDGDMTYYKRRGKDQLLPLMGGAGQLSGSGGGRPLSAISRQPAAQGAAAAGGSGTEFGPDGFPIVGILPGGIPPELGRPNTAIQAVAARIAQAAGGPVQVTGEHLFQDDWLNACKGKSDNVVNGTSSKTHCDFDYAGAMMEQMLLGLVAHRAGKRVEYDPATGRVTNMAEANDWLKRQYRPGWILNG